MTPPRPPCPTLSPWQRADRPFCSLGPHESPIRTYRLRELASCYVLQEIFAVQCERGEHALLGVRVCDDVAEPVVAAPGLLRQAEADAGVLPARRGQRHRQARRRP